MRAHRPIQPPSLKYTHTHHETHVQTHAQVRVYKSSYVSL